MDSSRPNIRTTLVSFLIGAAACGLAFTLTRSVVASDLELWAYDFLVNHGGYTRTADNIVVVAFDDETFANTGRFPVPRPQLADVIARISSGKPRVIGLDFFLTEARDLAGDTTLQTALTQAGNVILASQVGTGNLPGLEPLPLFCQPESNSATRGFCADGSPGALGFAFVNTPVDNDGFARSMMLLPPDPTGPLSFPLTLAQQYSGEAIRPAGRNAAQFLGRRIPYLDAGWKTTLIAWSPQPAVVISALAILHNKIDPQKAFADKLVLIGQSSDAARDRFFTPLFRPSSRDGSHMFLPAIELHAAAIHTLLEGPAVSVLSPVAVWSILFLATWVVTWITLRVPLRYGFFAVALAMLGLYGGAQVLMALRHCWMKFAGGEAALALVLPFSLTRQFIQERFGRTQAVADRQQMIGLFSRYVSPEVARQIWERKDEIVLAGQERTATVLFSDIRSFTALTAGKPSQQVLQWLNRYLTVMDEVITQEGGFLNKFIGDGLMVLFGVPLSAGIEEDARCAVRCGLRMLKRVEELNAEHLGEEGYWPIKIGIGIHTGCLTCGNVGSEKRLEYSVVGETVNLASRLESLTKELHAPIVMSADTEKVIRGCFECTRDLGQAPVRGFSEGIRLYTVETPATDQSSPAIASISELKT